VHLKKTNPSKAMQRQGFKRNFWSMAKIKAFKINLLKGKSLQIQKQISDFLEKIKNFKLLIQKYFLKISVKQDHKCKITTLVNSSLFL
jgi:hypothetical protein